jgi:hypothetical protein
MIWNAVKEVQFGMSRNPKSLAKSKNQLTNP